MDVRRDSPLTVRSEGVFGFEGNLQQRAITRELSASSVESWIRFQGEGRLVLSARGRKHTLLLAAERTESGAGLTVRPEHLLGHGEVRSDGALEWRDGAHVRLLRLHESAVALLEIPAGLLEMPLRGRDFIVRREVFVACDGGVELAPHEEAELGQRGLLRASGHGRLFLLRS